MINLLRRPEVLKRYGRARSTLALDIANGLFITPVAIGARCVAWPSFEVEEIIKARIAGKTDDEIRSLVQALLKARKSAG